MTLYDVSVESNESTTALCHCTEWVQNIGLALQKCSTVSEKIKILATSSFTKHEILSLFLEIKMYMINTSRNLAKEKGIFHSVRMNDFFFTAFIETVFFHSVLMNEFFSRCLLKWFFFSQRLPKWFLFHGVYGNGFFFFFFSRRFRKRFFFLVFYL